jgi:hypothetical protein
MQNDRPAAIEPYEFYARRPLYLVELTFYVIALCFMIFAFASDVDTSAKAIAAAVGLSLSYCIRNVVRLLRDPQPALQISEAGILNRTYWSSATIVAWDDVLEIRQGKLPWLLDIVLRNPDEFRGSRWPMISVPFMLWLAAWGLGPHPVFLGQLKSSKAEVYDKLSSALEAFELADARKHRALKRAARLSVTR